ncbi:hypothetical protein ACFUIT_08850 [Streptomyces sp. NPDC057239]|uniref:hypothetical protein n=1 Tax=Streptomyces sp. NPDC057239 TaxID=3346061 RepID=UPI003643FE91
MRTGYLEGRAITALARDHDINRGAIRTAVAGRLPEHVADEVAPAPNLLITLDTPGKVADLRRTAELDDAEQTALDGGQAVRRGTSYTRRARSPPPAP